MKLTLLFLVALPFSLLSQDNPELQYYSVDSLALNPNNQLQLNSLIDDGILKPVIPGNIDPKILAPYTPGNIDEGIWLEKQNGSVQLFVNDSTKIELSQEKMDELLKMEDE